MIKTKEFDSCKQALDLIDTLRSKKRKGIKLNSKITKKGCRYTVSWKGKLDEHIRNSSRSDIQENK